MIAKDINEVVRKGDLTKIENYDKAVADKIQTWICHHRLELTLDGEFAHSQEDLIRLGMYYNRPYFELIFLTRSEHSKLHKTRKACSVETRKKQSEARKGKHPSEETRKKMSVTRKGKKKPPLTNEQRENLRKPKSDFGKKYFNHYGYSKHKNPKLYHKEQQWYYRNHRCSWE